MRDRVFLDTNIIIYLYSEDENDKRDTAYKFVNDADCVTSIHLYIPKTCCYLKNK